LTYSYCTPFYANPQPPRAIGLMVTAQIHP
jgi:hypothetical protein